MKPATKRSTKEIRPLHAAGQSPIAALARVSIALGGSRDPDRILELVATSAGRLFGCQKSVIALLRDDSHQRLELAYSAGLSKPFETALRGWLAESPGRLEAVVANGPSLVPRVAGSRLPAAHLRRYAAEGIQALAALPLLTQGDAVGVLTLYFEAARRFPKRDLELLRSFGTLAGLAIANARVYAGIEQALVRHSQQLQALKAVNRELNATLDLPRLLEVVVERALGYTAAHAACVHLWDPDKGRLALNFSRGYPDELVRLPQARSTTYRLAERVRRTGHSEVIADVIRDPAYIESPSPHRSHLSVPVRHEGATLAVITLEDPRPGLFSDDHVGFVSQLAGQTAIALINARLFAAVSENHDRLRAVLNSTREGVLVIDAAGRIALVNPRIEEFWGMPRQALLDQNLADLLADPTLAIPARLGFSPAGLLELLINLSQNLDVQPSRLTYQVEAPLHRYLERSGTPVIDDSGRVIGWVLVVRDVSEEKQAEIAREELTGMIVHDLRSPMTTVFGSLKLIDDVYTGRDDTGFLKEAITIALRSSKRMVALVDSLLDIFRTDTGKIEIVPRKYALPALAANLVEEFLTFATLTEIHLVNEVPDELPLMYVDVEKIERVISNLIDNALKFTPADGRVTLSAGLVDDPGGGRPWMLVEVADNGPGIPLEYRDRVFDRYVKVTGREGRRRGTGLGLAFCKLAVEAHGGRIWVEGEPEAGSRFKFTLPLAEDD